MRAYVTLETFSSGPRFSTEVLDQPSRYEFTDYTARKLNTMVHLFSIKTNLAYSKL